MLKTTGKTCLSAILTFVVFAVAAAIPCVDAQSSEDPKIDEFVDKAYTAYQLKEPQTLISLCSQSSPYFSEFRQSMLNDFSQRPAVKIFRKRVITIKTEINGDKAKLRLLVNFDARNVFTGREAEGFPEADHTLYLVKEEGGWKLWRFVMTAEEFSFNYLTARTDVERTRLVDNVHPITYGLLKGLEEIGRALLEDSGDDIHAAEILGVDYRLAVESRNVLGLAGALVGLGDVYFARGDYARAADNYQEVLTRVEKLGIKEGIAAVSAKMGNLYYAQGNIAQAMQHYLTSVRLYEELGSTLEITYPQANLGNAYFASGNYEKALEQYQRVLKIYEQVSSQSGAAWLRNQIADVFTAQGKTEAALENYELSLKAHEKLGNRPMQAYSLNGIGRIRFNQGNYAEAITILTRAAVLARASHAHETLWRILTMLGQTHRALRQNDPARTAFSESITVIEQLRAQTAGTERDQELSFESKTTPYLEMVDLLIEQKDFAEAFVYAERAKGRLLLDVLRNGRADVTSGMRADEREREQTLRARVTILNSRWRDESLKAQLGQNQLNLLAEQIQKARLEYDAYETRIYAAHPDLSLVRGEGASLSLNEAGALILDENTAMLEYVVTRNRTFIFVLTKARSTGSVTLNVYPVEIGAHELSLRGSDFRQRLAGNSPDFKALARDLYELLLQPAQRELKGKTAICIVPAEGLWELPFQALLSKENRYVLEDHALFYAPSLSVLREMKKRAASQRTGVSPGTNMVPAVPRLLALGNPSLNSRSISQANATRGEVSLEPLPQAEEEVKALAQIYGPQKSTILIGDAAREESLKAKARDYSVLHFATHGVLDDTNPLYSHLLLAIDKESEDGFLEAREIMKLDLHADLAVLSACQTARGRVGSGEGIIGMSWAFFIAGTSTTIASQWKVDSASTSRLMIDFHRNMQSDRRPGRAADALRKAALKLMADPKYRHPFFWAGFVAVGDAQN